MLYLETPEGFVPWRGEPINNTRYPLNIGTLWTAQDLAEIGLYKPEETPVPEGKRIVSSIVAKVEGVVRWVHTLEDIPAATPADFPLSDRQLRIGLITSGVDLALIDQAIDGIEDPTERAIAKVWWDRSTSIQWDHPMRASLTALVGLSEEDAATMWMAAKDIAA